MTEAVAKRRLVKALAIIFVFFGGLGVCSAFNQGVVSSEVSGFDDQGQSAPLSAGIWGRAEAMLHMGASLPTEDIFREVGVLEGCRDVRASGNVVGYIVDEDASIAWGRIEEMMEERSWEERPMAGILGATFIKSEGEFTWAIVTCNQVGAATSIVARCG